MKTIYILSSFLFNFYSFGHSSIEVPEAAEKLAKQYNFEVKGYQITADKEELTAPR